MEWWRRSRSSNTAKGPSAIPPRQGGKGPPEESPPGMAAAESFPWKSPPEHPARNSGHDRLKNVRQKGPGKTPRPVLPGREEKKDRPVSDARFQEPRRGAEVAADGPGASPEA